jgi:hypothetical protein
LTTWRTLFEAANLSAGQRVLIHAAAGGVGTVAVQLAKWRGAEVWGTASEYNHDYLRDLGVDHAIDYNTTAFEEAVGDLEEPRTPGSRVRQRTPQPWVRGKKMGEAPGRRPGGFSFRLLPSSRLGDERLAKRQEREAGDH